MCSPVSIQIAHWVFRRRVVKPVHLFPLTAASIPSPPTALREIVCDTGLAALLFSLSQLETASVPLLVWAPRLRPPLLVVLLDHAHDVVDLHEVVDDPGLHGRRHPQGLMGPAEEGGTWRRYGSVRRLRAVAGSAA